MEAAMRIARLCYHQMENGADKEQVLQFRNEQYHKYAPLARRQGKEVVRNLRGEVVVVNQSAAAPKAPTRPWGPWSELEQSDIDAMMGDDLDSYERQVGLSKRRTNEERIARLEQMAQRTTLVQVCKVSSGINPVNEFSELADREGSSNNADVDARFLQAFLALPAEERRHVSGTELTRLERVARMEESGKDAAKYSVSERKDRLKEKLWESRGPQSKAPCFWQKFATKAAEGKTEAQEEEPQQRPATAKGAAGESSSSGPSSQRSPAAVEEAGAEAPRSAMKSRAIPDLISAVNAIQFAESQVADEKDWPDDVPDDHAAWRQVKMESHCHAYVFDIRRPDGERIRCQTTLRPVGGNHKLAARICRLLYAKAEAGADKEQVLQYRAELYNKYGIEGKYRRPSPDEGEEVAPVDFAMLAEIDPDSGDAPPNHPCYRAIKFEVGTGTWWFERMLGDEKVRFQATVYAAGGDKEEAARICRLAYLMLEAGADKQDVLTYREEQYVRLTNKAAKQISIREMFKK